MIEAIGVIKYEENGTFHFAQIIEKPFVVEAEKGKSSYTQQLDKSAGSPHYEAITPGGERITIDPKQKRSRQSIDADLWRIICQAHQTLKSNGK